jgi:protein disulfide-isomerase
MKKVLIILTTFSILISISCNAKQKSDADESSLKWHSNLEEAIEIAKQDQKVILVNFTGSDWCIWCIRLEDEVFSKDAFQDYTDEKLVLVKLDFPRSLPQSDETRAYNKVLLEKFGIRGFPTLVLLDENGSEFARASYQEGGAVNYVTYLESIITQNK